MIAYDDGVEFGLYRQDFFNFSSYTQFTVFFTHGSKTKTFFPFKDQYIILVVYTVCIYVGAYNSYTNPYTERTHNAPDRGSNMVCNIYGKHYGDV